jgi:hypothetical protein
METKSVDAAGWLTTLVDPGHPNLFLITIPTLLMMMLGVRKLGVIYFFGACMVLILRKMN